MMRKKYPHVLGRHGKSKILEDIRAYGQEKEEKAAEEMRQENEAEWNKGRQG
jgi:hypothetical protein